MCKTRNTLTALLLIGALAAVCHATPSFKWVLAQDPGPVGGATHPLGYTSWDLMYTVDTHVSIVAIYMESDNPAPGDFYQNPNGGITGPPSSDTITPPDPADPFAEFDTYITMPGSFSILAAATDIVPDPEPPTRPPTVDDQLLDITWAVSPGYLSDPGTFNVARVTLKDGISAPYIIKGWQRNVTPSITFEGRLPAPSLFGEVDGDGVVGEADLTVIMTNWGLSDAIRSQGDLNGNGTVDGSDYSEVLSYWAQSIPLPGDVNSDAVVDEADLTVIITNWGLSDAIRSQGDLNGNGTVDGADHAEVLNYWNPPPEPPGEPTPEPATMGLVLLGGLALLRRKR